VRYLIIRIRTSVVTDTGPIVFIGKTPARFQGQGNRGEGPSRKRSRILSPIPLTEDDCAEYEAICTEINRIRANIKALQTSEKALLKHHNMLVGSLEELEESEVESEEDE
jgi:hypothetical protein